MNRFRKELIAAMNLGFERCNAAAKERNRPGLFVCDDLMARYYRREYWSSHHLIGLKIKIDPPRRP